MTTTTLSGAHPAPPSPPDDERSNLLVASADAAGTNGAALHPHPGATPAPGIYGFCECGCGERTTIAPRTSRNYGWTKGEPLRFVIGHNRRVITAGRSDSWQGERRITERGYVAVYMPQHPRASHGYVLEHILVVETAMGKALRVGAEVHHVDENKERNIGGNLVACDGGAYHKLLHQRQRALDACGDAKARRCSICRGYDRQDDITVTRGRRDGDRAYHRSCATEKARARRGQL